MPSPTLHHDAVQIRRKYPCQMCPKSFTRSEHRVRHERSHTLEKPFSCRYCHRKYARRSDLVVRHEKTIHKDKYTKGIRPDKKAGTSVDALGMDVTAATPSNSSPETASPHGRVSIAPPATFPTQPCLDTILIDDLTSLDDQPDQREDSQQIPPDAHSEEHNAAEKTTQDSGLECPEPENTMPIYELSDPQDETGPYWPFLDIPPPFDVGGGFDFLLGSRPQSNCSEIHAASQDTPAFLQGLSPPLENIRSNPLHTDLPTVVIRGRSRTRAAIFTEGMRRNMISLLLVIGFPADIEVSVPPATVIQNCVRRYFEKFHIHHTLFHPHTLNLEQLESPLMLAICAIGALYRLDRKLSTLFFCMAERALALLSVVRGGDAARPSFEAKATMSSTKQTMTSPKPLWELQARVLLVFVAAIGGQAAMSRKAIDEIGFLACEYRILSSYLCRNSWQAYTSWHHWIERECKKRILHAILMISDILNITFRVPPIISVVQEYDVELPDDDELWNASTNVEWMLAMQTKPRGPLPSVRSAVIKLLSGETLETGSMLDQWSPCGVAVVMHAVSIHTWNLMQSAQSLTAFGINLHPAHGIQDLFVSHIEAALSRCYQIITNSQAVNELTWNEAEGPVLFNSLSLVRGIHARVLIGVDGLDRMVLLSDAHDDMAAAVKDYVTRASNYHAASAKSARVIFDSIMTILKSDAFLLRKTAALNWSIEHALVGIDCAMFLSSSIQNIQVRQKQFLNADSAELELLKAASDLLINMEYTFDENKSLAAGVLRMWKQFYDDVWVWGVTPRIARLFEQLACAYDLQLASFEHPD